MKPAGEWRAMLGLAAPLVLSELGWMAMGIEDTMFVGRVSAEAVGAISLGTTIFYTIAIFASGLMLGLDTLVSQAHGAKDHEDSRRSLISGLWLAALLIPAVMGTVWAVTPGLAMLGLNESVMREAGPYLRVLNWSAPALLLFFCLRRYLQAVGIVQPIVITLVAANLINLAGNWIFVFGHLGAPRLGAEGSAWSTCISRIFMLASLAAVLWRRDPEALRASWKPEFLRIRHLLRLGLPAAGQIGVEFGVFTTITLLAGRFSAEVLAGHQIALTTVTSTYMVPLGISSAAAVLVGQAIGRRDARGAARAGSMALALGFAIMSLSAVMLMIFPSAIARLFTPEAGIILAAAPILRVAAFFQLFDGLQVVATGALRGAGDTRTPMLCHFAGYWIIGLPLGAWLCFREGMGARGLWMGLSAGLILIGIALFYLWRRAARGFERMLQ